MFSTMETYDLSKLLGAWEDPNILFVRMCFIKST